ncbi:MAG: hypothetical protein WCS73_04675 [Lentisphaeria bacterium]
MLQKLSSFDPLERRQALEKQSAKALLQQAGSEFNMHIHSFFSYNGEGWSPSRIAYEMKNRGMYAAALCDFDVLQGMDEFLSAGDLLQLRTAVAMESRVYFKEYVSDEINSPGEPGVFYFMGMGFVKAPPQNSAAEKTLAALLELSHERNRELIQRINACLPDFSLDYDADVLPLTPQKNATERHIVRAYYDKAMAQFGESGAATFWSQIFKDDSVDMKLLITQVNPCNDFLRKKLMKRGGLGYKVPSPADFPVLDTVIKMILDCRAIPMSAWLDGSLPGEMDPQKQLECLVSKGVEAVNIIPDRNWNFKDPQVKAEKIAALNKYIDAAKKLDMPINIGTEANKPGQILVDDFSSDALKPHAAVFLEGAQIMIGHTRMLRWGNFSLTDKSGFQNKKTRNKFFAAVGALPAPQPYILKKLQAMCSEQAYSYMVDSANKETWQ